MEVNPKGSGETAGSFVFNSVLAAVSRNFRQFWGNLSDFSSPRQIHLEDAEEPFPHLAL
jgi:hypothetical protein